MSTPTRPLPPPDDGCGDPGLDLPEETSATAATAAAIHQALRTPRLDEQRALLALVETTGELSSSRYEPRDLPSAITLARMIATSPLCPLALRGREADVLLVMMTGAEIGLTTMQSLRNLYIVEGRIGMSAALIRGRCQKHGDCVLFEVAEADAAHAVVEVKKRGWPASRRVAWSIADAERAGLIKEDQPDSPWRRWPQEMCVARATTRAASMYFPEITSGLLSEEDLRDMSSAAGTAATTPAPAALPALAPDTALPIAGRAPGMVTPPSLSALDAFAAAGAAPAPGGQRAPAAAGGRHEPSAHARAARKPPKRADPGRNGGRAPASTAAARQRKKATAAGRNGR
jgi:RecT family